MSGVRSGNPRRANGHRRSQLRLWWKAQGLPCAICGQEIDYDLPAGNPMSFEVDEIVPVSKGGDPLSKENTRPTHRLCNERRGNRMHVTVTGSQDVKATERTRNWGF